MSLFRAAQRTSFREAMWNRPIFLWLLVMSSVCVLGMIALIFWKIVPLGLKTSVIPLHYNTVFGVDLIGPWFHILYLPLFGILLIAANTAFETLLWDREPALTYFFAIGTVMAEVLLFVSVVLISLLNI